MMTRFLPLLLSFPAALLLASCDYSPSKTDGPNAAQVGEYLPNEDPDYKSLREIGQRIKLQAIVRDYIPDAMQIGRDGVSRFQPGTIIQVITPGKFFGKELLVHHPTERSPESVWRDPSAQMTIEIDELQLNGGNPSILYEQEVEVLSIDKGQQATSVSMGKVMGS